MKKVLAIISQHPELIEIGKDRDEFAKNMEARSTFIKKALAEINDLIAKEQKEFWNRVEAYLKGKDLIPPDYDQQKDLIQFDDEIDVVLLVKNFREEMANNSLMKLLKQLTD